MTDEEKGLRENVRRYSVEGMEEVQKQVYSGRLFLSGCVRLVGRHLTVTMRTWGTRIVEK